MKSNECKREVIQLTTQLEKERELTTSKLQQLERRFGLDSKNVDFLTDRLGLLEKQLEQLHADVIKGKKPNMADDGSHVNAIETIPTVKSLLQSEVRGMYENLSKRLEAYVKEQVVLYTTVLGTVHKLSQSHNKDAKTTVVRKSTPAPPSAGTSEIADVVSKVNDTQDKMAQQVGNVSIPGEESTSPATLDLLATASNEDLSTASYEELVMANSSELVIKDDMSEANDTFSGENLELNETVTLTDSEISAARIGAGPGGERLILTDAKSVDDNETSDERESMLRDQTYRQAEVEERLKEEITKTLLSQLAEFIGVVEKRAAALEEKIHSQEEKNQAVATNISSKVKDLDQSVKEVMEQTDSLSQDLVASSQQLESLVYELKKNVSGEGLSLSALEIEEQIKKIKKMERLMSVYNKSLEPLQNETKVKYREMRELLDKESAGLRSAVKAVQDNISAALDKLNYTHSEKLFDIKGRVRALEDNVVILQVDGSNMQRKVNQLARIERESGDLQAAIRDISSKQRELKKKLEEIDHQQKSMADYMNGTAKQVSDLTTEVKLNILGEWMPMAFEFDSSRTDCQGEQYIKRVDYKAVRLVGVVLCSPTRYKIFLANTLQSKFLNVGDANGLGEDHCEFVGASKDVIPKLSPFRTVHYSVQGQSLVASC